MRHQEKDRPGRTTADERAHTLFNPPGAVATPDMAPWRVRLHDVIFEADTPNGRLFDIVLIWAILLSVAAVMLESMASVNATWGPELRVLEWTLTGLFTLEYLLRLVAVRRPLGYVTSFFGVIDLLSILPTYLSLMVGGTQALLAVRILRLLRVYRLFRLVHFVGQAEVLVAALIASREKITVFLGSIVALVVVMGSLMYLVEGPEAGFTSIPRSVYWAIVTLTTVGYGDIAPTSPLGQGIASMIMIAGYAIIAVPTGIVTVELADATRRRSVTNTACPDCGRSGHDLDARHCKHCGGRLGAS